MVVIVFVVFLGVQMYLCYSNLQLDITSSYCEKILNCVMASAGDVVEAQIYLHDCVVSEFKWTVKIVSPFSEGNFQPDENNT